MIDKSITMKTIITFTFLLFSYLGFSQTTREEVVQRNKLGQKLVVNTYTGTGNSEKLVKRTSYGFGEYVGTNQDGIGSDDFHTSIKPIEIETFGSYKYEFGNKKGEYNITELRWGVIKRQMFNREGKLISTWVITDDSQEDGYNFSSKYTILP